ncbi:GntR family transcriptional regulator [Corynebacterium uberis]|uniref:GntR family transcriptional regulator n=1 Tax=Corynebacterium TaxID=1716 RepID=UPI001D0B5BE1|nr:MULTISPECIES: GntR family transcriptional regulator [Corynebacterium]MCZ9310048.1 GntR family transcriptional regulator [Corynebacterium sp. c6VSa_13]UDL73796.1 GntR family transcriptional regulator [Corynebacterium uberis]UDL75321.1 GntR family transcriptional regulator [Corynebacterium uberis]UDL77532.1 GntR family transcriptional regulator [Corynebacterium uberis]UDL79819.1 GntR family transcriptional regulator [Corynebacterium uberis]
MPRNETKTQRAYNYLRGKILDHSYAPGHRLVLSTIAETLDVSVIPVREAIRQLEAENLVSFERNVGAKVTMVESNEYFDVMETVALLESRATALAAPLIRDTDISTARELNEKMERALSDEDGFEPATFTQLNKKFHETLFLPCPNERLIDLIYAEWQRLDYLRESIFSFIPERARESVVEHEMLLRLIEGHCDAAWIESYARDHRLRTSATFADQTGGHDHRTPRRPQRNRQSSRLHEPG